MTNLPFDPRCERFPIDIPEIVREVGYEWDYSALEDDPLHIPWAKLSQDQMRSAVDNYAKSDGTYNEQNGHFLCDKCYIEIGMPSRPKGWVCP